jgi:hypothetical protein
MDDLGNPELEPCLTVRMFMSRIECREVGLEIRDRGREDHRRSVPESGLAGLLNVARDNEL